MRIAGAIACLSLLIPNVGSPGRSHESGRSAPTSYWDTPALLPYRHQAYGYVRKGQLVEAAKAYEQAFQEAMRLGDKHSAVRFMNNVGACRMRLLQMRKAMLALLLTRKIAEEIGFDQVVRASTLNLSELYLHMGDLEAAVQAADRGLEALKPSDLPAYRIQVLLLLGQIRSRRGDMAAAEKLYYDAIALAERSKETAALGLAWNNLGYEYMKQAEQAISRAHQILRDDPEAELCFPNLAHLYLIKGDLGQSSKWMDLGVKAYVGGSKELPGWHVYQDRGKLRQAQGKHTLAFEDFRRALNSARLWRLDVVPANALRVSSESDVYLQDIYNSFLSSGYQVYLSHPSQKLMAEIFLVSEENRAWSLRQTLHEGTDSKLPDEYYELLAQMRSADSRMLNEGASKDGDETFASLQN